MEERSWSTRKAEINQKRRFPGSSLGEVRCKTISVLAFFPGLKESILDTYGSSAEGILIVWKLRMKTTRLDGPWYRGLLYPYGDLPSQHGGQHDGETEAHHLD